MIIYDIETGPLPREEILARSDPFRPFVPLGEFDPSTVKHGNTKDETKRAAKVEEKRKEHEAAKAEQVAQYALEKADYENQLVKNAALSATTAEILAIGYLPTFGDGPLIDDGEIGGEAAMLDRFWLSASEVRNAGGSMVGIYSNSFDLPFIVRRSWFHGVKVPGWILEKGRYWHPTFVDLAVVWKLGTQNYINLDTASKFFGGPGKNGEGAEFALLWRGTDEDRSKAVEYLVNDLSETARVAERMGVS